MRKKRKDTIGFIKRIYKPRPGNAGHINQILGKSRTDPECWYQHVKTKQEFWSINGALGWPAQDGSCDGYAVIIGVTKSKPLNFHALAETIAPTPEELIDACVALRKDYGFGFPHKLIIWRGDPERFPDWSLKNAELTKKKPENGFIVSHFSGCEHTNAFEIWLQTLRRLAQFGKGRVKTDDCPILRRTILNTPLKVCKKSLADFPIISAFGGLIHSLSHEKSWQEYVRKEKLIDCMKDEIFLSARAQEEAERMIYGYDLEENEDDYPDEPISTVE